MRKLIRGERRLQLSLAVAIAALFAALVVRAYWLNRTDEKLCNVIHAIVARSGATVGKPGTPGYAYYRDHPDELELARTQNRRFLQELPCKGG